MSDSDTPVMSEGIYRATIKMFGSQPEPALTDPSRMEALWGRDWGCDNDVGQLRVVMVHRPGDEFGIIDPTRKIEETGGFGDLQAGWYWQSGEIPPIEDMQQLKDLGIRTVEICDEDDGWIVNGLAVAPGRYMVPHGMSNRTRDALDRQGLTLIEVPYDKMHLNGGGIHCSTCPLLRDRV